MLDYRHVYIGRSSNGGKIKIGIATDPKQRWRDIDRSIARSKERCTFHVKTFFARAIERFLHGLFSAFRLRWKGSGKTEWFAFPWLIRIPLTGFAILLLIICRAVTVILQLMAGLFAVWVLIHLIQQ